MTSEVHFDNSVYSTGNAPQDVPMKDTYTETSKDSREDLPAAAIAMTNHQSPFRTQEASSEANDPSNTHDTDAEPFDATASIEPFSWEDLDARHAAKMAEFTRDDEKLRVEAERLFKVWISARRYYSA
jgi:hypothetical protein